MLLNKKLFSEKEEKLIVSKIAEVETKTSGEIRLYVEKECDQLNPLERARELFLEAEMQKTEAHTGVLIYLAYKSHHFAVWGDEGITKSLPHHFWDDTVKEAIELFKKNQYTEGIIHTIENIGIHLNQKFPASHNDTNQLPDDIIYG